MILQFFMLNKWAKYFLISRGIFPYLFIYVMKKRNDKTCNIVVKPKEPHKRYLSFNNIDK